MLGLVLPVLINLVAYLGLDGLVLFGMSLVQITTLLVLLGAILLAISLICYRFGFSRLRKFDRSFYIASVLCIIGSIGLLLIIVPTALVLLATPSLVQCVRSSPSAAVSCLRTVQPAASYSLVAGFWLAWVGGLGVVVGLLLGGRRFRDGRLVAGAVSYALLLLVLIDPFIAVLFPTGGWQYPLLTIPGTGHPRSGVRLLRQPGDRRLSGPTCFCIGGPVRRIGLRKVRPPSVPPRSIGGSPARRERSRRYRT